MNVKDGKLFMWSTCRIESMSTRIRGIYVADEKCIYAFSKDGEHPY